MRSDILAPAPLRRDADEIVCLETPDDFYAVVRFYHHFELVSDEQVKDLLKDNRRTDGHRLDGKE
ncbi:MAG TPA: hypothetical protein VMA09_08025 [Candidatus Binataceae bacterium]|nr:hypothetical protein [Candidatus Binataceae bacterium]